MEKNNEPAFAQTPIGSDVGGVLGGLTKREYAAIAIMAGFTANPDPQMNVGSEKLAQWSVEMADALLRELSK